MLAKSDSLVESLPCLSNSEGFIVSITAIASMERMETTMRSSISVKDLRSFRQEQIRERERERERESTVGARIMVLYSRFIIH
ncbi:MAG: hypothetical protein Q7K44_04970 [Candidatus Liptonbacteria bacterium]|nr:hypothetical protein [Candidatus Liptonbacteria bacterium]